MTIDDTFNIIGFTEILFTTLIVAFYLLFFRKQFPQQLECQFFVKVLKKPIQKNISLIFLVIYLIISIYDSLYQQSSQFRILYQVGYFYFCLIFLLTYFIHQIYQIEEVNFYALEIMFNGLFLIPLIQAILNTIAFGYYLSNTDLKVLIIFQQFWAFVFRLAFIYGILCFFIYKITQVNSFKQFLKMICPELKIRLKNSLFKKKVASQKSDKKAPYFRQNKKKDQNVQLNDTIDPSIQKKPSSIQLNEIMKKCKTLDRMYENQTQENANVQVIL